MNRVERDEIVTRGMLAKEISESSEIQKGPWLYKAKVKSGNRKTKNVEDVYTNIPHLMAEVVMRHAREEETLNIFGIQRVMKASLRSYSEDV